MTGQTLTVHAALARGLAAQGVTTLFGLLGDSNLFMADAFVRAEGGRLVPATVEDNAVLMALGHAAMTGDVGAATVTQGPAVSNAVTALIEGVKGRIPLVLLAGDTPVSDPYHPQRVAQEALVAATGAGFVRLRGPTTVFDDLATAFRQAWTGRRPVVLNMPTDMMWEPAAGAPVVAERGARSGPPAMGKALEDAVGIIAAARAPVILAGRGAIGAREALERLGARIGAPLSTTLKAKGLFGGAVHDLGVFGTLSTPNGGEAIARADCVIAFGAALGRYTTVRGDYLKGARLIQIDDDPGALGLHQPADAALLGDAAAVAETLLHWLDEAEIESSRFTEALDPQAFLPAGALPPAKPGATAPGTIDIEVAMDAIDRALPADRVFVSDGGRFLNSAWSRIGVSDARNMLLSVNVGAIGQGLGQAIGAALARPDQTVLLVIGDGGLMLGNPAELSSAVREALDLVIVICNDQAYGAEYVQFEDRQMDPGLSQFKWPSFAEIGRAMGAEAHRVTGIYELEAALAALPGRTGPVVIELMLDPAVVPRLQL
ncbi:thiamine pyrophosphate-binding protein [Marimonas arenosa]|uniref:Thiamine pyrophosphate-binding protein n=1 Tax=Marimonas arenosa TaxID=1795305 RepID=A0AAE3WFH7_9RHOB|nr:thiamine pyrophosphate-binding protein [Marimonas arenosa]MDQ2092066.1 thiamine pyrophosphate-binding protein [Marimonas arenosa]